MIDDPYNRTKVKRGCDLPQSKLTTENIIEIRWFKQLVKEAEHEIKRIDERRKKIKHEMKKLTNHQLSKYYGVHQRTIDKVTAEYSWTHVD